MKCPRRWDRPNGSSSSAVRASWKNNIIDLIMREEKPLERKVTIRNDRLQKYFPASYTPKQMEDVIIKLLEGWHRKRQQEQAR